jgi:hypothetical protein
MSHRSEVFLTAIFMNGISLIFDQNLPMAYILFSFYALIALAIIYWWQFFEIKGVKNGYLLAVFVLKLTFGGALAFIYSSHYTDRSTGDTYRFFDDAKIIDSSKEAGLETYLSLLTGIGLEENQAAQVYYQRMTHMEREYYTGFPNDNATIIRANAFMMNFSGGYYIVHIVFWSFFSMIGLTALMKFLVRYFPRKIWALFFSVYLLPTVLFWGSGVLKEPILILGLGLFLAGFLKYIYGEQKPVDIIGGFFGLILLIFTKGYVLICMSPAILGLLLVKAAKGRRFWLWFSIPHVLTVILLFAGPHIGDGLKVSELMQLKQEAFYNVAELSNSGSLMELPEIRGPFSVLANGPHALVTTYFRPWPWEWQKAMYIPAALENTLLILALIIMIWNYRKPYGLNIPILAFAGSFVLVLGVITGEVVPVLGAVVRYKLPSLIFLFVLIFGLTDHIRLQRRIPLLRKLVRKL